MGKISEIDQLKIISESRGLVSQIQGYALACATGRKHDGIADAAEKLIDTCLQAGRNAENAPTNLRKVEVGEEFIMLCDISPQHHKATIEAGQEGIFITGDRPCLYREKAIELRNFINAWLETQK